MISLFEIILLIMAFIFCCIITLKESFYFLKLRKEIEENKKNIEKLKEQLTAISGKKPLK